MGKEAESKKHKAKRVKLKGYKLRFALCFLLYTFGSYKLN